MGAAFFAPGEALVDAVAIGLVGNDENAAVGGSGRGGEQEGTGQKAGNECRKIAWMTPAGDERTALTNRPKALIMINHEPRGGGTAVRRLIGPKSGTSKALTRVPRYRNGGTMNGLLAICSICREIIS